MYGELIARHSKPQLVKFYTALVEQGGKMKKAILATKVGMTQIFAEDGSLIPVTVLEAGPCVVTQIKTVENDGYSAVQVGFGDKKKRLSIRIRLARRKSFIVTALQRLRWDTSRRLAYLQRDM